MNPASCKPCPISSYWSQSRHTSRINEVLLSESPAAAPATDTPWTEHQQSEVKESLGRTPPDMGIQLSFHLLDPDLWRQHT